MESSPAASSTEIMKDDTAHTSSAIAAAEATSTATATTAATTSNPAASSTSLSLLSEQDHAVYGTLNKELADALAEQITIAIRNGVDSLPLLDDDCYRKSSNTSSTDTSSRTAKEQEKKQDDEDHQDENTNDNDANKKTPKQNLCHTLKYKFIRNVDVLESYCAHHLFTLKKHLPARRKRIVSTITLTGGASLSSSEHEQEQEQQKSKEQEEEQQEEETDHSPTTIIRSKNELPSSKEIANLMNEVSTLQLQLELIRKERNELLVLQESTTRAEVYVNDITNATTSASASASATTSIQKTEKVVTDGNTIGRLAEEAKNMIQKLDTTTTTNTTMKKRDHNNGSSNKRLKKPLSMKETYEQDKKQLGLSLNANANANANDGLNTIKDMLLLSKEEESKSK
ncbi:hypothetical protein FRACYDRAFT_246291 [Fragilariopsis cylindrus CCMP1102]|uniref:Uncharacterized protein n=1 Tax=Fragilariopsis cylindrus CCMP1102 TaxID=635003 RepID=A0A1E7EZC1_9STRA|nr:hypothetical protein FRACYDRAFT_246291 [Fragilariopsis cylindrus CCMP1102]|eukprot:OEU11179.1 hypothetical protein FRACYDRAFT_246291 [Fragilariopsis cylindrus CCMP1102]